MKEVLDAKALTLELLFVLKHEINVNGINPVTAVSISSDMHMQKVSWQNAKIYVSLQHKGILLSLPAAFAVNPSIIFYVTILFQFVYS